MTDGISQDRVRRPALALRSQGVWVYALGIGRRYRRRQLMQIATNGRYVFTANFRSLSRVARRISGKICLSELSRVFMFLERVHLVYEYSLPWFFLRFPTIQTLKKLLLIEKAITTLPY